MDTNKFVNRHVGIAKEDIPAMLEAIGVKSVDELIDQTIPANIRLKEPLNLPEPMTERSLQNISQNLPPKRSSLLTSEWDGMTQLVLLLIQRNVFEKSGMVHFIYPNRRKFQTPRSVAELPDCHQ